MALTQEQKELVEEVGTEVSKDLTGLSPEDINLCEFFEENGTEFISLVVGGEEDSGDVKYIKINVRELLSLSNLSKESVEELFSDLTEDYLQSHPF